MRFSLLSRYSGVFPFHLSRLSVRPLSTPRLEEWIPASKKTLRSEEGDEFDESQTLQRSISYLNTDNAKPFLQAMANSRWLWLYKAIGVYTRQKAAFAAWTLYADTVEHILKPNFYKNLGIESQFSSQNELLLLHIWMLKERFMTASKDSNSEERSMGQSLKENLFSKLWEHHRYVVLVSGVSLVFDLLICSEDLS